MGEVMFAIRNLAVKKGNVPSGVVAQAKALFETGRVLNPIRTTIEKRESLGLGKLDNAGVDEVQKILKKTGLSKIAGSKEEVKE